MVINMKKQKHCETPLEWSYYWLPGFKPAENGSGYVPEDSNETAKRRQHRARTNTAKRQA